MTTVRGFQSEALGGIEMIVARFEEFAHPPHFHETYVIGAVEWGCSTFASDGKKHLVTPEDVVVIEPYQIHTGEVAGSPWQAYRAFYPSAELMAQFLGEDTARLKGSVLRSPELARRLFDLHAQLENPATFAEAELRLGETLAELVSESSERMPQMTDLPEDIQRVLEFIHDHPNQELTLGEMASVAFLSPFHFLRLFRHSVGMPPHRYLINLRLEKVRRMLAAGATSVEAALRAGFTDQSHLNRCFKRYVGSPPGRFSGKRKFVQVHLPGGRTN